MSNFLMAVSYCPTTKLALFNGGKESAVIEIRNGAVVSTLLLKVYSP
jgi:hypothetical protein